MDIKYIVNVIKYLDLDGKINPEKVKNKIDEIFPDYPFTTPLTDLPEKDGKDKIKKYTGFSISGVIGSGKTSISNILVKNEYKQYAFAGAVKDISAYLFNLDRQMLEGDTSESRILREQIIPNTNITPRNILQKVGTEVFREFDPDIWLNVIRREMDGKVIITDARFLNELNFARDNNIKTIRVIRPSLKINENQHISETEHTLFRDYDYIIINDGTLNDLEEKVKAILE